jgi:DNA polymerase-3 subunit delta'
MLAGFEDLLGQGAVLRRLLNAVRDQRLHHCYLFEGPPSVGKHTAAVLLAMAAACTGSGELLPCKTCPTCFQMAKGLHPDLLEIGPDPTKKTPVISRQQSREIVRQVGLRSYNAKWRTFVIDPVDLLQPAAANALLKTLEEPPSGTGFILVTSRASSLLPTILSRSQRVRFRPVPEAALTTWLQERGIDESERIARLAQGSPGRALALSKGGLVARDEARTELLLTLAGGVVAIVPYAEKLVRGNRIAWQKRFERVLDVLEGLVRDTTLVGAGQEVGLLNQDRLPLVRAWADALWPRGVQKLQAALFRARRQLHLNVNGRLMIETLLCQFAATLGKARKAA